MKRTKGLVMTGLILYVVLLASAQTYAAGEPATVTGELIDTYCYALMDVKGESHRQCAIDCVKAGIPAGILEDGTKKVYVLLPNKDKTGLPAAVLEKMAKKVTISGKAYAVGGSQFLTIESIK